MRALENKIPPPVVTALFGLLMWLAARYVPGLDLAHSVRVLVALLVVAVGVCFSVAGVLSFRQAQTTVNPLKPETASALVRSGIYQYSRNPMYVGLTMLYLGGTALLNSPWPLAFLPIILLVMDRSVIPAEERHLEGRFGEEYRAYCERVRRWL